MSSIKLSAILAAALLAGCAENDISNLEDMKREGKDFARHLANEYEMYAKKSSRDYNDFIDASHFAVKGQQATTGLNVLPEDPRDWDVPASSLKELLDARERLTFALDNGVRADFFASMAAKTQVSYDCWVQEVEEMNLFRGRPDQLNKCKDMFLNHIKSLESAMAKEAPMFVVHFGENSAMIGAKDAAALDNIAKVSKHLDEREVMITGYTDGKGGRKSNLALSQKRADAVRDELVKRGVLENRITSRGVGEGFRGDSPSHRKVVIQIR